MTIVLFLIDTSASMAQKTYQGITMLDVARSVVEMFLKQRVRDASSRGDRYMLMSFEEFPTNVKCGWRESQNVFQEQLKSLKAKGLTTFSSTLASAFRFVNVNRMQTGIDNYGCGRYPFYIEPVVIIAITDGCSLTCSNSGVSNEVKIAKPTTIGYELTEEPFRWDHRLFALVLRMAGCPPKGKYPSNNLPSDSGAVDAMCAATGGRSFNVSSHKMLQACVELVAQKIQQQGVLIHLEKIGPDPPIIDDRINGIVENGISKCNGDLHKAACIGDGWKSVLLTIYSRASRAYPGYWPIPEAFWPDRNMAAIPPRKAHPIIMFRCEASEPLICQDFPFDKYELEPSPLTQFILDRKQSNVGWQVFIGGSCFAGTSPSPFGYLKAATNLQAVNLFIMPYNYPVLLSLIDEAKLDPKVKTSHHWRVRLEKYLLSVPSYYIQPLKKAFAKINISSPIIETDQGQQYSYNILSYLAKVKHVARDEFDAHCSAVTAKLQQFPPSSFHMTLIKRNDIELSTNPCSVKKVCRAFRSDNFHGYLMQVSEPKLLITPSLLFRNSFEIKRNKLNEQLQKMRLNLTQQLESKTTPIFEGGRPGTFLKLQHAEDLHNLPIGQMGNYQEYVKGLEATGRGALREIEPSAIRAHAFGNPFKIDKKNMTVDEVGEGSLLTTSSKSDARKRLNNCNSSNAFIVVENSRRPPKKKPGPLPHDSLSVWKKRRRNSDSSSVVSDSYAPSVSSIDEMSTCSSICGDILPDSVTHSNERKRKLSDDREKCISKSKKARYVDEKNRLNEMEMRKKKLRMGEIVRKLLYCNEVMKLLDVELDPCCSVDQRILMRYAMREAFRFKRKALMDAINKKLLCLPA